MTVCIILTVIILLLTSCVIAPCMLSSMISEDERRIDQARRVSWNS